MSCTILSSLSSAPRHRQTVRSTQHCSLHVHLDRSEGLRDWVGPNALVLWAAIEPGVMPMGAGVVSQASDHQSVLSLAALATGDRDDYHLLEWALEVLAAGFKQNDRGRDTDVE